MARLSDIRTHTSTLRCGNCLKPYTKTFEYSFSKTPKAELELIKTAQWPVDTVNEIASDEWQTMAKVMLDDESLCEICRKLLGSALSDVTRVDKLISLAQLLDPENSAAFELPVGPISDSVSLKQFLDGACRADNGGQKTIEPQVSQLKLDALADRQAAGVNLESEIQQWLPQLVDINEADFRLFVEKFEGLRNSKYFALAMRDNTCVGFWIARLKKGYTQETQLALKITTNTLEYMLDNITTNYPDIVVAAYSHRNLRSQKYVVVEDANTGKKGALVLFNGADGTGGIRLDFIN